MSISCDATIKWKVCMYTLLNMLLLRVVKRLSFRIDELDCNLAPQCLHVAKTCLWCGFPFPSCSHKKCENFSVSYVTRITPKYLENGTIVFRNASVKETHNRFACLPRSVQREIDVVHFGWLVKKSTLISNREVYICTLRKLFRTYVFILSYFTRFQKFFVEGEFEHTQIQSRY